MTETIIAVAAGLALFAALWWTVGRPPPDEP